ncbi:hypothetical protein EAH88_00165 [Rhodanobacter glycinis]|uniref:Uncharacterized protein n=1 Tax=Rhodanobacter glycinis TaxID=582702 RepID=A0A502CBL8_9GAMM|nr:hypothetical protein [Rhodanobacter glycinis]TPG11015.1 hypothetical protein EAH88_00165 [Rhodanobacter glycinis]
MGRVLRKRKKIDYHQINHKYDKLGFAKSKTITIKVSKFSGLVGRASSAPPQTSWPLLGMHGGVDYIADIINDVNWMDGSVDTIWLPFKYLDITGQTLQGMSQVVAGADADVEARAHFDDVSVTLRTAYASTRVTEAVGEAAAAICILENYPGFQMIWGAHVHSGTGIDQIWRRANHNGSFNYLVVEAKGPGAGLIFSPFLPTGYNQMEEGWVVNHLYSMDKNGHAAGEDIVAKLGLKFAVAHKNFAGGSKSYYGLDGSSAHKTRPSTIHGLVVSAFWRADGRLGYNAGTLTKYL